MLTFIVYLITTWLLIFYGTYYYTKGKRIIAFHEDKETVGVIVFLIISRFLIALGVTTIILLL